jgi:hypothetical protein
VVMAVAALALVPGAVLALPMASPPAALSTVAGAQLDSFTGTSSQSPARKQQGLSGYDMTFHTTDHAYALPLCSDVSMAEVDNRQVDPASLVAGDNLAVTIRPDAAASAKACVARIVRYQIGRGASTGDCLQDFQVKHIVEGNPKILYINTAYNYQFTVYARPSFDCDGQAYGSAPITTKVASQKPFIISLTTGSAGSQTELMRWTVTTDAQGKLSLSYSFTQPRDDYKFTITPGENATPGDSINWTEKVLDPHPQASTPMPMSGKSTTRVSPWPVIILLVVIAVGAGTAEYIHRIRYFKRQSQVPEEEYQRAKKINWHN